MIGVAGPVPRDLHRATGLFALAALSVLAVMLPGSGPVAPDPPSAAPKIPLSFVPNLGQTDRQVRYYAQAPGIATYFMRDKVVMSLAGGPAVELRFMGALADPRIAASDRRAGHVNYFHGDEHHTGIPTFGRVTYRELWPGIDLVFAGRPGKLKYEFDISPGADPSVIQLAYAGVESLSVSGAGALAVHRGGRTFTDAAPRSYQGDRGVASRFALRGERSYGFALGPYDHARPLVIDPSLDYATYLGERADRTSDVAVAPDGSAYVVGTSEPAFYEDENGEFVREPGTGDAFVAKLSPSGASAEYFTYLGGSEWDEGRGIAVDQGGNAYVTGLATPGFPTTAGAYDRVVEPGYDAFLTKLDPSGSNLVYSTVLGAAGGLDYGVSTRVDAAGNTYVGGHTSSPNFPTTPGAFDRTVAGDYDPFVAKFNANASALDYSTVIGTSQYEILGDMAIDDAGHAYITGATFGSDYPTTPGAYDTTREGFGGDAYITKFNASGTGLTYSTLLGRTSYETGYGIDVDQAGAAYVAGSTANPGDFPTTPGAYDRTFGGDADAFVTKLAPSGTSLIYSTFLGGGVQAPCCLAPTDYAFGIAVDWQGRAAVTGYTGSEQFPTTPDGYDRTRTGPDDQFVTMLNPTGSSLVYSTFLGGSSREGFGANVAVDRMGGIYASGTTESSNFPVTPGAYDTSYDGGGSDGFLAKFDLGPGAPATLALNPEAATNTLGEGGHCVTATLADAAGDPTPGIEVSFTVTGATTASGSETTDANGQTTFCYQGPELPGTDQITATFEPDGPSDTATKTWVAPPSTEDCKVNAEGRIRTDNGDRADFGLEAKTRSSGSVRGRARYIDRGPAQQLELNVKSIDALVCEGRDATIFAHQGSVAFRIEASDRSANGRQDRFRIVTAQGYDSGKQPLQRGNVKVR